MTIPTPAEVIQLLHDRQGKKTYREFCPEIHISTAYLSDIYKGNRIPGAKVLRGLGFPQPIIDQYRLKRRQP